MSSQNFQLSPNGFNNQNNYTQPFNSGFSMPEFGSQAQPINVNNQMPTMQVGNPKGNQPVGAVNTGNITGNAGGNGADWTHGERAFGGTDANGNSIGGYAMPALQLGSGLLQGYIGMKQLGIAQQGLDDNKEQFNLNYDSQRTLTNSQLRDRQRARVSANPNAQDVDSYMNENQIQER